VPKCTECVTERSRNTSEHAVRRKLRSTHVREQYRCGEDRADDDCAPAHG
jgi:hypothetical protein